MSRNARLGYKVRRIRRERGLTQAQMADTLGISASYLNLMENNQRAVTVPVLLKLARLMDVDLQSFAEDEEARLAGELVEIFGDSLLREREVKDADLTEIAEGVGHIRDLRDTVNYHVKISLNLYHVNKYLQNNMLFCNVTKHTISYL